MLLDQCAGSGEREIGKVCEFRVRHRRLGTAEPGESILDIVVETRLAHLPVTHYVETERCLSLDRLSDAAPDLLTQRLRVERFTALTSNQKLCQCVRARQAASVRGQ